MKLSGLFYFYKFALGLSDRVCMTCVHLFFLHTYFAAGTTWTVNLIKLHILYEFTLNLKTLRTFGPEMLTQTPSSPF